MSTTTTERALALTADDIRALRDADDWTFWHRKDKPDMAGRWSAQPVGTLTAITRPDYDRRRDCAYYDVPALSSIIDYGDTTLASDRSLTLMGASHWVREIIRKTIVDLLRPGDELEFEWGYDNWSPYLREHGLVSDHLLLHVRRPRRVDGHVTRRYAFHVAEHVGPDNSARMLRQQDRF